MHGNAVRFLERSKSIEMLWVYSLHLSMYAEKRTPIRGLKILLFFVLEKDHFSFLEFCLKIMKTHECHFITVLLFIGFIPLVGLLCDQVAQKWIEEGLHVSGRRFFFHVIS